MHQEIVQIAGRTEGALQNIVNKSADMSTGVQDKPGDPKLEGAREGSGQDKFCQSMNSFIEVMKEKESSGSVLKWDRKALVIKAETPKGFMTEIVDLERLFSELGFKTHRKQWGVFRNTLQGKGKETLQ